MEQSQSIFKKYGLLLSTVFLFGTMIFLAATNIFRKEAPADFKEVWKCGTISLTELKNYYNDDGTLKTDYNKIVFATRIDDLSNPYESMILLKSMGKNVVEYSTFSKITMTTVTVSAVPRLIMSNNEIMLEELKPLLFDTDATGKTSWKKELDHLQLTPGEHDNVTGYFTVSIQAMKSDNTPVVTSQPPIQANPCPPGRPR